MAAVLFYENPVPLNTERHRKLRLSASPAGFGFARKARSVLLAGIGFFEAAKGFPISLSNLNRLIHQDIKK